MASLFPLSSAELPHVLLFSLLLPLRTRNKVSVSYLAEQLSLFYPLVLISALNPPLPIKTHQGSQENKKSFTQQAPLFLEDRCGYP